MSDDDLRARFEALRDAVTPLDGAPAAIDRAVTRRRRRPVVAAGALTGLAATAVVAVALLPSFGGAPAAPSSATVSLPPTTAPTDDGGPWVGFEPVTSTGETVGEWAASADVLVVVVGTAAAQADGAGEATVVSVPWRRSERPDTPAGGFELDSLPLGAGGEILLSTALGSPPEVAIAPSEEYLLALRWERVRCDAEPPGWVLLGDGAVLPHAHGIVTGTGSDDLTGELPELDAVAAHAFAGLEPVEVAETLDEVRDTNDVSRAPGACE